MISGHGANWAVRVDVFTSPALVALLIEWAASFHKIVFPTILAGAFELV